jgi:glycerol uptake facilitator-like aquaporin
MTFLLVTAYLRFAQNGAQASVGAWAIGATLAFAILAGGAFTGGSLNPARTFGITLPLAISSKDYASLASPFTYVVYFFGPLIGATLAVLLNNFFEGRDDEETADMERVNPEDSQEATGE